MGVRAGVSRYRSLKWRLRWPLVDFHRHYYLLQQRRVKSSRNGFDGAHSRWPVSLGVRVCAGQLSEVLELQRWMDEYARLASEHGKLSFRLHDPHSIARRSQ